MYSDKAANPNRMFNPALQVSSNWPWLIQRPRVKNSLFHLVTLCLTAWLPSAVVHIWAILWVQKSLKEPKAASLSFPLINTMVSCPSCSAMRVTILQCIQQNNIMNCVPLATLVNGLYVFDLNCSLSYISESQTIIHTIDLKSCIYCSPL